MTDQIWLDPWLALREKTATRNQVAEVIEYYSRIFKTAACLRDILKAIPTTSKDTIEGLDFVVNFAATKRTKLYMTLEKMDAEIKAETERLNNENQ